MVSKKDIDKKNDIEQKNNSIFHMIHTHLITANFKFRLFISMCMFIHCAIAIFSIVNNIIPLFIFNIASITIYLILIPLTKMNKELTIYVGYLEIVVHSFVCVNLIGDEFGFSLYFLAVLPICYNLLHSCNSKHYLIKGSILAYISFVLYVVCYCLSSIHQPLYISAGLDAAKRYVYIINMFIAFFSVSVFSILFLVETGLAYNRLSDQNKKLGILANHDPLTGLFNRRTMTDQVETSFYKSQQENTPFSIILCDIDNFKKINDTYGHDCGDEVLKAIANTLSSLTRSGDFLCRWGGEEFLILLNSLDSKMGHSIAERFRSRISELSIPYGNEVLHITMTFGVATSTEATEYETLFKLADERLYKGKQSGKNCVI